MRKSKFTDTQIVAILREAEQGKKPIEEICRDNAITPTTFYRWKKAFGAGGGQATEGRRLKDLETENARLKKALAEQMLAVQVLKEINAKKW